MPFSFDFSFNVPGIANPFSASPAPSAGQVPAPLDPDSDNSRARARARHPGGSSSQRSLGPPPPRRPSPSPSPSTRPLNRKRAWFPALAEPTSATVPASSSGYLDTPSKYRDMAAAQNDHGETEHMVVDLPPSKKRRTIAGSIISTALSAALIGTAVGLTVYRLWRDRSKEPEALPPPPYQQGDWVPVDSQDNAKPSDSASTSQIRTTPATPQRRKQQQVGRHSTHHRKTRSRTSAHAATHLHSPSRHHSPPRQSPSLLVPTPQPEFDFPAEPEVVDDQMDWMGDKLSQLIAEGKRALGREVVVMSDAPEDEVDDATGDWVDAVSPSTALPPPSSSSSSLASGSLRRGRPHDLLRPSAAAQSDMYTHPASASPRRSRFENTLSPRSAESSPTKRARGGSLDSTRTSPVVGRESEAEWQSPEMRQFMENARAARQR